MEIQPKDTSRGHFYVSLAKSFLRIGAGMSLMMAGYDDGTLLGAWLKVASGLFILAECLGVLEELV
jgi:hypothetical protein